MKITRLDAPRCDGGENPMWDADRQVLHYIDNSGRKVHTYDPANGTSRTLEMPAVITTLVLRRGGGAVVTLRSGVHFLDLDTGALELVQPLPDPPPHVYNDGKVVFQERIVVGAAATPTPNFSADMQFVIFQPEWGVPGGIKNNELAPMLRRASADSGGRRRSMIVVARLVRKAVCATGSSRCSWLASARKRERQ